MMTHFMNVEFKELNNNVAQKDKDLVFGYLRQIQNDQIVPKSIIGKTVSVQTITAGSMAFSSVYCIMILVFD